MRKIRETGCVGASAVSCGVPRLVFTMPVAPTLGYDFPALACICLGIYFVCISCFLINTAIRSDFSVHFRRKNTQ
jgi:hypothetical protein